MRVEVSHRIKSHVVEGDICNDSVWGDYVRVSLSEDDLYKLGAVSNGKVHKDFKDLPGYKEKIKELEDRALKKKLFDEYMEKVRFHGLENVDLVI